VAGEQGWQAMFNNAFRQSRNAMVLLDGRRVQLEANGAYLKLLGYKSGDVLGRPFYEFTADGPVPARTWAAAVARGDFTGERELVCAGGDTVTVQWGPTPRRSPAVGWSYSRR
jgi:PAS domain S-box-containing protein